MTGPDTCGESYGEYVVLAFDIRVDDELSDPAVVALLQGHVDQLRALSPPESTHALDLDGLRTPGVTTWVAREGGRVVGCVALSRLDPDHPELKSMRTDPAVTGRGVGTCLLRHVLDHARRSGLGSLWLETGAEDFFAPARRLYARHGFVECPPFGGYRPDPLSVFMSLSLSLSDPGPSATRAQTTIPSPTAPEAI